MRKNSFKVTIYLANILLFFCVTAATWAQRLDFIKNYSNVNLYVDGIAETKAGGYLLVGGVQDINGGDYVILDVDSAGNIVWINHGDRFDGFNWKSSIASAVEYDNHFYLSGACIPLNGGVEQIYIVKCDSSGNKLWDRTIPTTGMAIGNKIDLSKGGDLICSGYISDTSLGSGLHPWLIKIDTSGNILWNVAPSFPFNCEASDFVEVNNKIIFAGWGIQSSAIHYYSLISCIDSSGTIFWSTSFVDTSASGIRSISIDSGYIYAGQFYHNNNFAPGYYKSRVIKMDINGNQIWNEKLDNLQHFGNGFFVGVDITSDHKLAISCDGLEILKTDMDCIELWKREQDTAGYSICGTLVDKRNRIAVAGRDWQNNAFLALFSDTTTTEIDELYKDLIEIYPNPVKNIINIKNESEGIYTIRLLDITGRPVRIEEVKSYSCTINVNELKNGIYFLEIINSGMSSLSRQKIIVQH